jgi:penicillin-binding protein 1C
VPKWVGWGWVAALLAVVTFFWPYPEARLEKERRESLRIVDRAGRPLHESPAESGGFGRWVPLSEISPFVIQATLSAEDANFRSHPGIDPSGIARALWLNASAGRIAYGGSTLTQQLAKVLEPEPPARTLWTKALEARNALRLELALSKAEILEQYLNRVYYGRLAYGVEAASFRFFGKASKELTLDEAALLAILPRAPSAYDPSRNPARAERRRAHVLSGLARRGWIAERAVREAAEKPIVLAALPRPRARHVLDALARSEREEAARGGTLRTTVDLELTRRLEARIRQHLADLRRSEADQAAIVVLDNASGDVLALVGSRDYEEAPAQGAVNAALAPRAPGSALKPFVYALALGDGKNGSSPLFDVPTTFRDFQPRNASTVYLGRVSLREALGNSLNIPAVRLAGEVGLERFAGLLDALGLVADSARAERDGLALALGSAPVRLVDLANAYATLARGGEYRPFRLTHPEAPPAPARRVIAPDAAFLVTELLADPNARRRQFGVETPLELPFPVAVKTGTSKSFCDNVTVGYSSAVTVAVWVGNFDGRPMHRLLAMQGAAPLFRDAILLAMEGRSARAFAPPAEVETAEICAISGLRRGATCPHGRHEHVARRHPLGACTWHSADGTLRLPAALRAFDSAPRAVALDEPGERLEITSPAADARLALDGLVPRSRQKLPLRALVRHERATRVRWEIDGRAIAEVPAPFTASWTIEPGTHHVRAVALADSNPKDRQGGEAEDALAVAEVKVEVHGEWL